MPVKNKFLLLTMFSFCNALLLQAQQWNGLTLYSNMNSALGYLIDTTGTVVKTWNFTGNTGYSTHMMPGGTLFRSVSNSGGNVLTGGGMTGRIQKVDYSGTILWDYTYSSSTYCLHHDHCPLPNGNVLVISYDVKTAADVAAAGGTLNATVWSEKIMELQPVGTNSAIVVWEWKLWDHLVQNVDVNDANYASSIVNNPQLLNINYKLQKDWVHMNGIDYNPALDQISLSSHNLNEWYIIDHSTSTAEAASHSGGLAGKGGDFLYRWGNPAAYQAVGTTVLNVTHDAHWIPEGCPNAGNLAGINNKGSVTTNTRTTADQAIIPRVGYNYTNTIGSAYTPLGFSSRKISTGYATNMSSSDEFPNGNVMICLATVGSIIEVDSQGNVLWTKSTSGMTPQAHRYSECYINNPAPPQPTISVSSSGLLSSSFANSYQWYMNGSAISNATTQTFTASQTGTYTVKTSDGNGCVYVFAAPVTFSAVPFDDTAINEIENLGSVTIYPNPSNGFVNIDSQSLHADYHILLTDISGKVVYTGYNEKQINVSNLDSGMYQVKIHLNSGASISKKITLIK